MGRLRPHTMPPRVAVAAAMALGIILVTGSFLLEPDLGRGRGRGFCENAIECVISRSNNDHVSNIRVGVASVRRADLVLQWSRGNVPILSTRSLRSQARSSALPPSAIAAAAASSATSSGLGTEMVDSSLRFLSEQRLVDDDSLIGTPDQIALALKEGVKSVLDDGTIRHDVEQSLARADAELRSSDRTIADIIGPKATSALLENIENSGRSAASSLSAASSSSSASAEETVERVVRAVTYSSAVKNAFGTVLYESIFAFIREADILGKVIEQLPGMQLVREEILRTFRAEVDRTAGPQIKKFIGGYLDEALERLVDTARSSSPYAQAVGALSQQSGNNNQDNIASVSRAIRDGIEAIINTPVRTLLPETGQAERLRNELAPAIAEQWAILCDDHDGDGGDVMTSQLGSLVTSLEPLQPGQGSGLKRLAESILEQYFRSEEGQATLSLLKKDGGEYKEEEMVAATKQLVSWLTREDVLLSEVLREKDVKEAIDEIAHVARSDYRNELTWRVLEMSSSLAERMANERQGKTLGSYASPKLVALVKQLTPSMQAAASPGIGAVIRSSFVQSSVTSVLYEAIFAFLQSADLVGNILAQNPILGPVRQVAIAILRDQIDQTAGVLIKEFLSRYSEESVDRLASIVTSERNQQAFAGTWGAALDALLAAPLVTASPPLSPEATLDLYQAAVVEEGAVENAVTTLKERLLPLLNDGEEANGVRDDETKSALVKDSKAAVRVIINDKVLSDTKSVQLLLHKPLSTFLSSDEGQEFLEIASALK
eukprot:jgi/Bigna1/71296/fgenesh1_pg.15_\